MECGWIQVSTTAFSIPLAPAPPGQALLCNLDYSLPADSCWLSAPAVIQVHPWDSTGKAVSGQTARSKPLPTGKGSWAEILLSEGECHLVLGAVTPQG